MRSRPLPQRHAYDLSLFVETIQATLNKPANRAKGPLEDMTWSEVEVKEYEESKELNFAVERLERLLEPSAGVDEIQRACAEVEGEAADLAITALGRFVKARELCRHLERKE